MRLLRLTTLLAGAFSALLQAAPVVAPPALADDRGTRIERLAPERVAAISTFAADSLVALGVTPVGASTFGDRAVPDFLGPAMAQVPSLGQRASTNLELLSELQPELILAIRRYTEPHARQFETIAPFYAFDVIGYDDSLRAVAGIAAALGQADAGRALNDAFEAKVADYAARAPGGIRAVLLAGSGEAPFAYYDHFLSTDLLGRLGATNATGPSPTSDQAIPFGYQISLEQLLALNPDVIFMFASSTRHAYADNPIWPHLEAVQNGRVYEVGLHWKEGGGPIARNLILEEMAWRLYPKHFEQPQVPAEIASRTFR
ncbi:ferrichrome ABC transporter substrate-binding protein [Marinobacterium nitratireducens]|uniref:Ferrichrome ABC transporter substrate-binding protein n=1 Tax=Marinobacterium nitratireducens TaxID=518897 RepID=A0A917ZL62_9GAMM|nr:ABC transporter substrate-binding protein [Marinobacterium nitratireducens]GGO84136.1 ferrichrome ABC transporter substrate-binding protein [Marinobacterium nitratireducens]